MIPTQRLARYLRNAPVDPPAFLPRASGAEAPELVASNLAELRSVLLGTEIGKTQALAVIARHADALRAAGEIATAAAGRIDLQFHDILNFTGTAFVDPVMTASFRNWCAELDPEKWRNELRKWATRHTDATRPAEPPWPSSKQDQLDALRQHSEELEAWLDRRDTNVPAGDPMPGSLRAWAQKLTHCSGQVGARLAGYLGERYGSKLGRLAGVIRLPARQAAANWPRVVASVWPPVADGVDAVAQLHTVLTDPQALLATVRTVLGKRVVADPAREQQAVVALIERLVEHYKVDGQLTQEGAALLMGRRSMVPEAVIDRALIGFAIMADEVDALGAPNLFGQLLKVQGIESFLERVIHGGGHEHAYVFEVLLVARALFESVPADRLWMQVYVDGKMGPDIVRIFTYLVGDASHLEARIVQAKSFLDLNQLVSPNGKIRRQLVSDLRRLAKEHFHITGPDGRRIRIGEMIEFKINWLHLNKNYPDLPAVLAPHKLKPEDLYSLNSATAARARAVFYDTYMASRVQQLNDWLQTDEFRRELGLEPGDWMPDFGVKVDLVDHVLLDPDAPLFGGPPG